MLIRITASALLALALPLAAHADLKAYVEQPDESYGWTLEESRPLGDATVHILRLTSQTWRGIEWQHWLSVVVPNEIAVEERAMLMIGGSDNLAPEPRLTSDESQALLMIAQASQSVAAVLEQVPNQPLFDGLYEDEIIAYTYEMFLETGESDWPLLFPMAKSAVRAMDAIGELGLQEGFGTVDEFLVTGGSKRGWTTWLTAAVDPRVKAIAPMVIDTLNMPEQSPHQLKSYGTYSAQVEDYTERGLQQKMASPEGQQLVSMVDPYSYIDQLTMPKLVVLGTNDEYWTVDSSSLYFQDLKGEKYLFYDPNDGHGLSLDVVGPILSFYNAFLHDEELPEFSWDKRADGTIEASWEGSGAQAQLWVAQSETRDFRQADWTSQPLEAEELENGGRVEARVEPEGDEWVAYYVEVTWPTGGPLPKKYTTEISVLPEGYPDFSAVAAAADGESGEGGES